MATIYTVWQNAGEGHSELAHIRDDQKYFTKEVLVSWISYWKSMPECTLITKGRTDQQSNIEHILYEAANSNTV